MVKASLTISGGRFIELGSTRPLEATPELNREIKKFRTPFAQEVENNGETVTYSLRSRNAFAYEGSGDAAILTFRPHRIIALDDTALVTVVLQLTDDGSASRLDQPEEWLRATKALAHFDSVVPGFGIIPADYPTAYIEFPGRSQLDAHPNRDVGHSVEALGGGNHMLVAHLGQDRSLETAPPGLRSPDGFPLNLQNPHSGLAADVHVSLRTFGGGSAFIDEDHNGAGFAGERFPAPTGRIERLTATTIPLATFADDPLPVYYLPPSNPGSLQPDSIRLCAETRHTSGSSRPSDSHGCTSADIAYDAEPPQLADGLRGPNSLSPSVLTLTCLDPWRECQVLAECRDRNGIPHQGLLPNLSAGSATVHSASTLAENLSPAGFLNDTANNPGHCQFHSNHRLSVLHRVD